MKSLTLFLFLWVGGSAQSLATVQAFLQDSASHFGGNLAVNVVSDNNTLLKFQTGTFTDTSKVHVTSVSKLLSATVVLALAQKEVFRLTDSIGTYLPVFSQYGKGHFTIEESFCLSYGMCSHPADRYEKYQSGRRFSLAESVDSIAAWIPLKNEPGVKKCFDGKGMQAVGRAAEILTGDPWNTVARDQIFDKTGMHKTSYTGYDVNPSVPAGVESTPGDLAAFVQMILNNGQKGQNTILETTAVDKLFSGFGPLPGVVANNPFPDNSPFYPYPVVRLQYGFGAWILGQNPMSQEVEEIVCRSGKGTMLWIDRKRKIGGVFAASRDYDLEASIHTSLEAIALIRKQVDRKGPVTNAESPKMDFAETKAMARVFSISGQLVFRGPVLDGRIRATRILARAQALSKGVYVVQFQFKNQTIIQRGIKI